MKRRYGIWVGAAGLTFLFVWQQIQSVRLGYEIEKVRSEVESQRRQNAYLRMEVERALAPSEVARAAKERLLMAAPLPGAIVILGEKTEPTGPGATARISDWSQAALKKTRAWLIASRSPGAAGSASAHPLEP